MPRESTAATSLVCCRLSNHWEALGLVTHLLHASKPFNDYPFGKLAATLNAQIQRSHYAFTLRDQEVVGYVGWALCMCVYPGIIVSVCFFEMLRRAFSSDTRI